MSCTAWAKKAWIMTDEEGINENIEAQIESQGMAAYKVTDGEVFVFTTKTLETFLESSKKTGRLVVFIKTGAVA